MPPNSYDVSLPKEVERENPKFHVSVINLNKESDDKVRLGSYEEALKEIGEGCDISYQMKSSNIIRHSRFWKGSVTVDFIGGTGSDTSPE